MISLSLHCACIASIPVTDIMQFVYVYYDFNFKFLFFLFISRSIHDISSSREAFYSKRIIDIKLIGSGNRTEKNNTMYMIINDSETMCVTKAKLCQFKGAIKTFSGTCGDDSSKYSQPLISQFTRTD